MFTPIPPKIPSSGQFSSLQINQDTITDGNLTSNGYVSGHGSIVTVDGSYATYTVQEICGSGIIRINALAQGPGDTLPNAAEIAAELGLPNIDGVSFSRNLSIYVPGNQPTYLTGDGWTFPATNYLQQMSVTGFVLFISYSEQNGWNIVALINSSVNLS
jgi:hypothetical protein